MRTTGKPEPDCDCVWRLINRELVCEREDDNE